MLVDSSSWLCRITRTRSPSRTRIWGPGTCPLYPHAVTCLPGLVSQSNTLAVSSKTLTPPTTVGASGWLPIRSVFAGNALIPASWCASISAARSWIDFGFAGVAGGAAATGFDAAAAVSSVQEESAETAAGSATAASVPVRRNERRFGDCGMDWSDTCCSGQGDVPPS